MRFARIIGTGSFLPGDPVSNAELIRLKGLESSHDWIVERTGIHSRHIAEPGALTSDLAVEAALRALHAAGKQPDEIDLIIVASTTSEVIFPSIAAILQDKLGVTNNCPAFDVQAVCSGFSYALTVAEKFIRAGSSRCALVVGAEVFSNLLDWSDRGTCVLFGDGAGAVVLEASTSPGIIESVLHADGRQRHILHAPGRLASGGVIGDPFLRMDGQAVFKFAVNAIAGIAEEVMVKAGIEPLAAAQENSPDSGSFAAQAELTARMQLLEKSLQDALSRLNASPTAAPQPAAAHTQTLPEVLAWLCIQNSVPLAVLRQKLLPLGLMPSAVMDDVNERAYDVAGEPAVEEAGGIVNVQRRVLLQVLAVL